MTVKTVNKLSAVLVLVLLAGCHSNPPKKTERVITAPEPTASSNITVNGTLPPSFDESRWHFLRVDGKPLSAFIEGEAPELSFMQGSIGGNTGCNRLLGDYTRQNTTLRFERVAATRRYCEPLMEQETRVLSAIERTRFVMIVKANGYLVLLDTHKSLLAELEPVTDTPAAN